MRRELSSGAFRRCFSLTPGPHRIDVTPLRPSDHAACLYLSSSGSFISGELITKKKQTALRSRTPFTNQLWQDRQHDIQQNELAYRRLSEREKAAYAAAGRPSKSMRDSFVEGYLHFASEPALRHDYLNSYGGVRMGKILEDLDALSGAVAYQHTDDDGRTPVPAIVTASVDRIDLLAPMSADRDYKLSGHVTYVGKSSMEITTRVESISRMTNANEQKQRGNGKPKEEAWEPHLLAKFTMVARDPQTGKALQVNPLDERNFTAVEQHLFDTGQQMRAQQQTARQHDLSHEPPTAEEMKYIHGIWRQSFGDLHAMETPSLAWNAIAASSDATGSAASAAKAFHPAATEMRRSHIWYLSFCAVAPQHPPRH